MHTCKIGLAVIALGALAPTISSASPDKASLDACVSAFAKSLAASGSAVPTYKLIDRADAFSTALSPYFVETAYSYDLEARNSQGDVFARVRCSTNGRGIVSALAPLPLEGKSAAYAARN